MTQSLAGKVTVITGGTTGIGLAIAKEFVAEGATVIVTGLDQEELDKVGEKIGPRSFGVKADASSLTEMDALLKGVGTNRILPENSPLGRKQSGRGARSISLWRHAHCPLESVAECAL
jgi:NAD(P)-dependent dehydrogenase (short-subunit alcohol dehydrogenase family)